jgi:hypothetical protein
MNSLEKFTIGCLLACWFIFVTFASIDTAFAVNKLARIGVKVEFEQS